ncbi:C2 calcium-dependent domain-containing protein 4C-like [Manacus candei]|uniref:C2 calcium-dependent domain-containing protein 4C-like n=1 Tax=Manacus candei TaxID=415023 RepID=UPI002226D64E|nr:C2 calcium-dependent domain-containing protein 4C-like [Manacus candei]
MSLWEGTLQGKSSSGIFFHVVTPDRIPQFTIPSLDVHGKHRGSGKGMGQLEGTAWRSSSDPAGREELPGSDSSGPNSSCSDPPAQPSPDPTAWAALSLPHLPKVTTPYGFVTLGQSPQVTREEAFFHSGSGHPRGPAAETRPGWQEEPGCCRPPGMAVAEGDSQRDGGQRGHKQPSPRATALKDGRASPAFGTSAGLPLPGRCASPVRDIQRTDVLESKEEEKREKRLLGVFYQRSSSSLELPAVTGRKNLFQRILRRRLVQPRQLKPVDFTLH